MRVVSAFWFSRFACAWASAAWLAYTCASALIEALETFPFFCRSRFFGFGELLSLARDVGLDRCLRSRQIVALHDRDQLAGLH